RNIRTDVSTTLRQPPTPTHIPYTTLFRSHQREGRPDWRKRFLRSSGLGPVAARRYVPVLLAARPDSWPRPGGLPPKSFGRFGRVEGKRTWLKSSHDQYSYAGLCLKKNTEV